MTEKKKLTKAQQRARESAILMSKYQKVFNSPEGKEVLEDIFKDSGMMDSSYNGNANDTMFNEGRRSVCLRILKFITTDHEKYMTLVTKTLEKGDSNGMVTTTTIDE